VSARVLSADLWSAPRRAEVYYDGGAEMERLWAIGTGIQEGVDDEVIIFRPPSWWYGRGLLVTSADIKVGWPDAFFWVESA
jgi:hypothetical protein